MARRSRRPPASPPAACPFQLVFPLDAASNVWVAIRAQTRLSVFPLPARTLTLQGLHGGGLDVPQAVARMRRHVWVSNYYSSSVSEFQQSGRASFARGRLRRRWIGDAAGIAIDGAGNVWVANYETASVSEWRRFKSTAPGSALSPVAAGFTAPALLQPFRLRSIRREMLWVSNFGNDTVTEFMWIAAPVRRL